MGLLDRIKKSIIGEATDPIAASPAGEESHGGGSASEVERVGEAGAGGEQGPAADAVLATLTARVSELSNGQMSPDLIDPAANLFDFGYVDSLSAVTLIAFVEERYGVTVSELDLVGALDNLRALAEHIQRTKGV